MIVNLRGALVAANIRKRSWTDRDNVPHEETDRCLYLVTSFDEVPHKIVCDDPDLYARILSEGSGSVLDLDVEIVPTAVGRSAFSRLVLVSLREPAAAAG